MLVEIKLKQSSSILPKGSFGFAVYTLLLAVAVYTLPDVTDDEGVQKLFYFIGALAIWRYSWGFLHFIRSIIFRYRVFPKLRARVKKEGHKFMPSHIYLLITTFRIDPETTIRVYKGAIKEAIDSGVPVTIVPSIVDMNDDRLISDLFKKLNPPKRIKLHIVRVLGKGKREGLAQAYRAISRNLPPFDSVVAVIDGDSILSEGLIRKTVPFFGMMHSIGGLTTDEDCEVKGGRIISDWHSLRFAQRNISMGSWALSKRLSALTGRMSMFRGSVLTDPDFIGHVEHDHVNHWRFGRMKFLTGDDKTSCLHLMKKGWDLLYVPDVEVHTVEHPPSKNFITASTRLLLRWSGNMLRTNGPLLKIGPDKLGYFIWWCVLDQRITMWTTLSGPVFVGFLIMQYQGTEVFHIYFVWIAFSRWIMSMLLLSSRRILSWTYPFLIYYSQIYGALVKVYMQFRLNKQTWTRQKTKLESGRSKRQEWILEFTSLVLQTVAVLCYIIFLGVLTSFFKIPKDTIHIITEIFT